MFAPRTRAAAMGRLLTTFTAAYALSACASSGTVGAAAGEVSATSMAPDVVDSAVFVTRLGVDTVAVERVIYAPHRVEADVLLRVPATRRRRYMVDLSPTGDLTRLEALTTANRMGRTVYCDSSGIAPSSSLHPSSVDRNRRVGASCFPPLASRA